MSNPNTLPAPFAAALERRRTAGTFRKPAPIAPRRTLEAGPTLKAPEVVAVHADQLFPTPRAVADRLVMFAIRKDTRTVLEPSSGTGALVRAVLDYAPAAVVTAYEINPSLARHTGATCADFLTVEPQPIFDAVVMNPPFAGCAEVAHVMHAGKFLRPGGRFAAVMSAAVTFRQTSAYAALNHWLKGRAATVVPLPDNAFAESGTNVRTVLVTFTN